VHFVIHAVDRPDALATRAKHYRARGIHLDDLRKPPLGVAA